jgi:hypothetical protein
VSTLQLPKRVADWPPAWRELYEERAAIIEFQGNKNTQLAERLAEADIRWQFQQAQ